MTERHLRQAEAVTILVGTTEWARWMLPIASVESVMLRSATLGANKRPERAQQFLDVSPLSLRLGRLADDNKRCPVFGVGLFGILVDHRQHGFAQGLGVGKLRVGG